MAFNGAGVFARLFSWATDKTNAVAVTASRMDSEMDGFATGLSTCIAKDGQTSTTARIPFGSGTSAAAGSLSSVAYSATNDANTGIYFPGTDQVALVAGGTAILAGTTSLITIPTGVTITATTTASTTATGALIVSGGVGIAGDIYFGGQAVGKGAVPVGAVVDWAYSVAPAGWLLGFGQAISRTTYAALFAVIGTQYGAGNGSTTFNIPDFRGRATVGRVGMGGSTGTAIDTTSYGIDPGNLGALGGVKDTTLGTANIPQFTPAGSVAITDTGHAHSVSGGTAGSTGTNTFSSGGGVTLGTGPTTITIAGNTTGITAAFNGTAFGQASPTAISRIQPSIILDKMIYTGVT